MIRFLGALGVSILLSFLLHLQLGGSLLDQTTATVRYSPLSHVPKEDAMVGLAKEVTSPLVLESVARKLGLIQADSPAKDKQVVIDLLQESLYVVIEKDSFLIDILPRGIKADEAISLINTTVAEFVDFRKRLVDESGGLSDIKVIRLAGEGKRYYPPRHYGLLAGFFTLIFILFYFLPTLFFHSTHHS